MGASSSSLVKRVRWIWGASVSHDDCDDHERATQLARFGGTPFIFKRTGSMYFDEDGDLAHEFYYEVYSRKGRKSHRCRMVQQTHHLIPQGEVTLSIPRLHTDFPVLLCEAPPSCS